MPGHQHAPVDSSNGNHLSGFPDVQLLAGDEHLLLPHPAAGGQQGFQANHRVIQGEEGNKKEEASTCDFHGEAT